MFYFYPFSKHLIELEFPIQIESQYYYHYYDIYCNLVPRVLSNPTYGVRGRVGENPGNEVALIAGACSVGFDCSKAN